MLTDETFEEFKKKCYDLDCPHFLIRIMGCLSETEATCPRPSRLSDMEITMLLANPTPLTPEQRAVLDQLNAAIAAYRKEHHG